MTSVRQDSKSKVDFRSRCVLTFVEVYSRTNQNGEGGRGGGGGGGGGGGISRRLRYTHLLDGSAGSS